MKELLLAALAAVFIIETLKSLVPWNLSPWTKHMGSLVVAISAAVVLNLPVREALLFCPAAAGLSNFLHRAQRLARNVGDRNQLEAMRLSAVAPRRRF